MKFETGQRVLVVTVYNMTGICHYAKVVGYNEDTEVYRIQMEADDSIVSCFEWDLEAA